MNAPFDSAKDRIREASDIVAVISQYLPLKKAGRNFKGLCPFHADSNPSLTVSPDKQIFRCFACNTGGDVIRFVQEFEKVTFPEALRILAQRAGIPYEREGARSGEADERQRMLEMNRCATQWFQERLRHKDAGRQAREYLQRRGILPETVEKFRLGFSVNRWDDLAEHLKEKGFPSAQAEKAGLLIAGDKGYYDRFRNRLIFPIFSVSDDVIGFGARVMDDTQPKYINSPESPLFQKGRTLYGLNFARRDILERHQAILCEGYVDVIRAHQEGVGQMVASLGTAFTEEHCTVVLRYTQEVVLAYDGDKAGQGAAVRGAEVFLNRGVRVRVAVFPEEHDPDSYMLEFGRERFQELVDQAPAFFEFRLAALKSQFDVGQDAGRIEVARQMMEWMGPIRDGLVREVYVQRLSEELGIRQDILQGVRLPAAGRSESAAAPGNPPPPQAGAGNRLQDISQAEADLLRGLFLDPGSIAWVRDQLDPELVTSDLVRQVFRLLIDNPVASVPELVDRIDDPAGKQFLAHMAVDHEPIHHPELFLRNVVLKLKIDALLRRYRETQEQLRQIESLSIPGKEDTQKILQLNKDLVESKVLLSALEKEQKAAVKEFMLRRPY